MLNNRDHPLTPWGPDTEAIGRMKEVLAPGRRRSSIRSMHRETIGPLNPLHLDAVASVNAAQMRRQDKKLQAANIQQLRDLGQQLRACGCTEGPDLFEPYPGPRRLEAPAILQGSSPKSDLSRRDLRARQAKEGLTDLRQLNHAVTKAGRGKASARVAVAGPREIAAQRKAACAEERGRAPRTNCARGQAEDEEEPSEEELSPREREVSKKPAELPIVGSPLDRKAIVERLLKRATPSPKATDGSKASKDQSPKPELGASRDAAFEAPRKGSSSASDGAETPLEALRGHQVRERQVSRYGSANKQVSKERLQLTRAFVVHKDALGEVHKDSVVKALESYIGTAVYPELVHEAYDKVTTYNSLNLEEFIRFAGLYEAHEEAALSALFGQLGAKGGRLPTASLEKLLASCGITPMSHVLQAILDEVRGKTSKAATKAVLAELAAAFDLEAAGAEKRRQHMALIQGAHDDAGEDGDEDGVTFEEFKKLVELMRSREGFVKAEVERYMHMFDDYDTTGDMKLDPREIMGVMCHLGYALDFKGVISIISDVKGAANDPTRRNSASLVDGDTSSLERREFLTFMRKAREREVAVVRELFAQSDLDYNQAISSDELNGLLGTLGYVPQAQTIEEAREDIGLESGEDRELLFHEVWQFLEVYRLHHGLSQSDYLEVEETYRNFDADGNGVLDVSEVGKLFRFLGYGVSYHSCMRLMSAVNSTHIDLDEFVELVRKYREKRTKAIFQALVDNEEGEGEGEGESEGENDVNRSARQTPGGAPAARRARRSERGAASRQAHC